MTQASLKNERRPATPRAPLALEVSGLRLDYGRLRALDDVSLATPCGGTAALIGPNGAGKSSLVRAICGRAAISKGTVRINGVDANSRAARRALGVAPQRAALYDQLTARENLINFARQAGAPIEAAVARAEVVLDLIGMAGAAHVRACRMSGGMRQRVNIGAAVMHEPALVILDEPTANLDPEGAAKVDALVGRLKSEGYGVLLITHDMDQARALADDVFILNAGRIIASGPPQEVIRELCGNGLILRFGCGDPAALRACGFRPETDCDGAWRLTVASDQEAAAAIAAIAAGGSGLSDLSIKPACLGDALAAAIAAASHPEERRAEFPQRPARAVS